MHECVCPVCGAPHSKPAPEQIDLAAQIAERLNAEGDRVAAQTAQALSQSGIRLAGGEPMARCMMCGGVGSHSPGCVGLPQQQVLPDWLK